MSESFEGATEYAFSFGPWKHTRRIRPIWPPPFGNHIVLMRRSDFYRDLGFVGIQFHDDDIVPDIDEKTHSQLMARTKTVKAQLDDHGFNCGSGSTASLGIAANG